ncbi:hypothetical protein GCM10027592_07190 [Spirosoma flavus]
MEDYLIERVSRVIEDNLNITKGSTPVPFFGNFNTSKSCTISINPSDNEFIKKSKSGISTFRKRLISRNDLNIKDNEIISMSDCEEVLKSCLNYFQNDPYRLWFDKYNEFLNQFDLSYYKGTVVHLDIVQWATTPFWQDLSNEVKNTLIYQDLPFLKMVLDDKNFEYIFLNGDTTVNSIKELLNLSFIIQRKVNFYNRRITIYYGHYKNSKVIGWSGYLQSAQIGGYQRIRELATLIKNELEIN